MALFNNSILDLINPPKRTHNDGCFFLSINHKSSLINSGFIPKIRALVMSLHHKIPFRIWASCEDLMFECVIHPHPEKSCYYKDNNRPQLLIASWEGVSMSWLVNVLIAVTCHCRRHQLSV